MLSVALSAAVALGLAQAPGPAPGDEGRELIELTCLECHSGAQAEAGLDLEAALRDPGGAVEPLTRAVRRVEAGDMPPSGPLDAAERGQLRAAVHRWLDVRTDDPGRPTLRRLTRSQLQRVLADLTGLDVDVRRFLERDASAYGFDTTGDTLFMGPLDLERWFDLAQAVAERCEEEGAPLWRGADLDRAAGRAAAIETLAARAFRRPARPEEVTRRAELVEAAVARGLPPRRAMSEALRSVLLSPSFVYRVEEDRPDAGGPWEVDEYELATRLAFFLFGGLPDAGLLERAAAGELRGPADAQAAAARMLADPRARWLAEDFAAQWLGFRELEDVTPDVRRFRAFKPELRRDLRREAEHFFADLVRHDRSVLELLDSRHAFLNDRLAAHYGLPPVGHGDLRRTPIDDRRRGGVLGMGALLTVTSTPLRTSPVQRGQWVLERLLGRRVPPPPPDAGALPEDDRQGDGLGQRERLERHRADPACASCHALFDPYGLALEAFDGIGRWRVGRDGEPPIETAVRLPGGSEVDGPIGLKLALLTRPEPFLRALQAALFTYAVGRPPGLADDAHLREALEAARAEDYRFSAIVRGIVGTPAFTSRRLP